MRVLPVLDPSDEGLRSPSSTRVQSTSLSHPHAAKTIRPNRITSFLPIGVVRPALLARWRGLGAL